MVSNFNLSDKTIFALFDTGEVDHFCSNVLLDWLLNRERFDGAIAADTINKLLIEPLQEFCNRSYINGHSESHLIGQDLVLKFTDLAYRFNHEQFIPIETAAAIKLQWVNFIAYSSAYRIYNDIPVELKKKAKVSKTNKVNAAMPKKLTPAIRLDINQFITAFKQKRGKNGELNLVYGLHKAIQSKFGISRNTIKANFNCQ